MFWLVLRQAALMLACAAHAEDYQAPRTVYLGDSITVRLSAVPGWTWRDTFIAAGGQPVLGNAPKLLGAVAYLAGPSATQPQISRVYVLLGANDHRLQNPIPGFTREYAMLVGGLRALGEVRCVLPTPKKVEATPIPLEAYRVAIEEVCGDDAIDPREALPEWDAALFEDGTHPNEEGSAIYAEWLTRTDTR